MDRIAHLMTRYFRDERGATAIEYGLIAGLISLVVVAWATLIGQRVRDFFLSIVPGLQ